MPLAIIILNWNAAEETITCVQSIREWISISPDIYVIDNNSSQSDKDLLVRNNQDFKLVINPVNTGFAGGNNIGIRAALTDGHTTILLLNNDARMAESDIAILLDTLKSSSTIGVIGPVLYGRDAKVILNAGGKDIGWNYISHLKTVRRQNHVYDVDYVSGTAMLVKSEVFRKIGLLDERYFFSGEVADFCKRVRRYRRKYGPGWRVVIDPRAHAIHDIQIPSSRREKLYTYYIVRNRFLYIRKFLWGYAPVLYVFWLYKHMQHAFLCYKMGRNDIIKVILRAMLHGLIGKYGQMPNADISSAIY